MLFSRPLSALVEQHLMPRIKRSGYKIVADEPSDVFDNAIVVVEGPAVRLRVVRERGEVFIDFGSVAEPAAWFDSTVVMETLALRSGDGWHSKDAKAVLTELASFIVENEAILARQFDPAVFQETKGRLTAVRQKQDAERWG